MPVEEEVETQEETVAPPGDVEQEIDSGMAEDLVPSGGSYVTNIKVVHFLQICRLESNLPDYQ